MHQKYAVVKGVLTDLPSDQDLKSMVGKDLFRLPITIRIHHQDW
jgi:stalled ribosome alternative rescue factor ArfA